MTDAANSSVSEATNEAGGGRLHDAAAQVRERVSGAYGQASERVSGAYDSARAKATDARQRAADGIEENPVAALIGGLALGALAGALLPRTQKEAELLGPLGSRIGGAARTAAEAAREAGRDRLDELGISKDSAREQVSKLLDTAAKAAGSAGSAAVKAAREKPGA